MDLTVGETKQWPGGWVTIFPLSVTGSLGLEMSPNGGANWYPVQNIAGELISFVELSSYAIATLPTGVTLRLTGTGSARLVKGQAPISQG